MVNDDKIILQGLEFYGYHGILPVERRNGQRFILDIELYLDLGSAGKTDDIGLTIDYTEIFKVAREVLTGTPQNLIETVAEELAGKILAHFPVKEVMVRVKKPQAPVAGKCDFVGVEIKRVADDFKKQGKTRL